MNNQLDMSKGYAIHTAIREAKEKVNGKSSYSIPLMTEIFPATTEETIKEQDDIKNTIKALESRRGKLTNIELAELSRLKSREQALTRHLMSLGYKEKEIQVQQIEQAEILKLLKDKGVEVTAEELAHYL